MVIFFGIFGIYKKNNKGIDILQKACIVGNKDVLIALGKYTTESLEREFGNDKKTMLIIASEYSNKDVVDFLLDHGANYSKKDIYQKTPLMYAYDLEQYSIIKSLLAKGADPQYEYIKANNLINIKNWLKSHNKGKNKANKIKTIASELSRPQKGNNLKLK